MSVNTTYYFFCSCEDQFGQPVHHREDGEHILAQCPVCRAINSKRPTKKEVHLVCDCCGKREQFSLGTSFYKDNEAVMGKTCSHCHSVGFVQQEKWMGGFYVEMEEVIDEPCDHCKKNRWALTGPNRQGQDFLCPYCSKILQQRSSLQWEDKPNIRDILIE